MGAEDLVMRLIAVTIAVAGVVATFVDCSRPANGVRHPTVIG